VRRTSLSLACCIGAVVTSALVGVLTIDMYTDTAGEEVEKEVDRQYKQVVVQWCAALAKLVYAEN
jgi:hypothetical protein